MGFFLSPSVLICNPYLQHFPKRKLDRFQIELSVGGARERSASCCGDLPNAAMISRHTDLCFARPSCIRRHAELGMSVSTLVRPGRRSILTEPPAQETRSKEAERGP